MKSKLDSDDRPRLLLVCGQNVRGVTSIGDYPMQLDGNELARDWRRKGSEIGIVRERGIVSERGIETVREI